MKTVTFDDTLYQLVPKEPTIEQQDAMVDAYFDTRDVVAAYKAGISAAPTPPAQPTQELDQEKIELLQNAKRLIENAIGGPAQPKQPPGIYNCTFSNEPVQTVVVIAGESAQTAAQPAERKPLSDCEQIAGLILDDPETGERMKISSNITTESDNAMRFTVTNPKSGRRFGVYLGISELRPIGIKVES